MSKRANVLASNRPDPKESIPDNQNSLEIRRKSSDGQTHLIGGKSIRNEWEYDQTNPF
jgi:hypothetical protein